MRRLVALAGGVGVVACANIAAPPGGPPRTTPPALLGVTPESGAVNVRPRSVVFVFDAVVNDRGGGAGGTLANLFLLSPREGRPRVNWRRERVEVRPRRSFRANTAYTVTMLPGVSDLRGNVLRTGQTIVFSTGPSIPQYAVYGRVFDWPNERLATNAFIEVIRRPDSLLYVGVPDSMGQFAVGPLDKGTYTVRAFMDINSNQGLDPGEAWDSVAVVIEATSPFLELLLAPRDTIAPRLLTVNTRDSLTLMASFDRAIDYPTAPPNFRVVRADSVPLRIVQVRTRAEAESQRDTIPADTVAQPGRPRLSRDTTVLRQPASLTSPKPSRPAPPRDFAIRLDSLTPLQPGVTYRVTAINARGLLGATRTSDRTITVPRPRPDTTRSLGPRPP